MKKTIIKKWKNDQSKITFTLYQYENGVRFLHADNPATNEFAIDVVLYGGAYFEEEIGVPKGTAHLFEHLIFRPNKQLKTLEEIDAYKFGTRERPTIFTNASTGKFTINFYAESEISGQERTVKYIEMIFDHDRESFTQSFDDEKNIVLAEYFGSLKDDRNQALAFSKFMLKDEDPAFTSNIIGTEDSIKSISVDDIIKYRDEVCKPENIGIGIQTCGKISKKVEKYLDRIVLNFEKSRSDKYSKLKKNIKVSSKIQFKPKKYNLHDTDEIGHFQDKDFRDGVGLDLVFVQKREIFKEYTEKEYMRHNLSVALRSLLNYLLFKEVREKLSLVYNINSYLQGFSLDWNIYGISMTVHPQKMNDAMKRTHQVIYHEATEFLQSDTGNLWLENEISKNIYSMNINYNERLCASKLIEILSGYPYAYESQKARQIAKKISAPMLAKYLKSKFIKGRKFRIWAVSNFTDKKCISVVESGRKYFGQ